MILFDESSHTYTVDGEPRESVSHYIERHKQHFPKDLIAQKTAERDGRDVEDVLKEWELKGRLAREYGSAIHSALELWINHGVMTEQTHLKGIVDKFIELGIEGKSEVVVYDDELAGTIDLVEIVGKKRANIYDFKTNGDLYKNGKKMLPPYEHLSDSPIDCYTLQLSLYKRMLEYHGWTVEEMSILHINDNFKKITIEGTNKSKSKTIIL